MSFLSQATDSQMKFHMQFFQVQADYVAPAILILAEP
jgi:hypothetical protein